MKDAVGGSLLLNLVVIFTSIVILFFAGILAYSKAYNVKNKIIEVIERNETYTVMGDLGENLVEQEISQELGRVGYRISSSKVSDSKCSNDSSRGSCVNLNTTTYQYCVCMQNATNEGITYEVITYVHFAFPVIGDMLTFPVKGETRVLGKNYDY